MFGTPLNEAFPDWPGLPHRVTRVQPEHSAFSELSCSLLTVQPKASGKKCQHCEKPAHLVWPSDSVCLDCLGGQRTKQRCYVCDQADDHCLSSGQGDRRIAVCVRCLFDTVNYVRALQTAAADVQPTAAEDSEHSEDSTPSVGWGETFKKWWRRWRQ